MTGKQSDTIFFTLDPPAVPAIEKFCGELLTTMAGLESAFRQLHPPQVPAVGRALAPFGKRLADAVDQFSCKTMPASMKPVVSRLQAAADLTAGALHAIIRAPGSQAAMIGALMKAMRRHCRAQEILYPLHPTLRPVGRYFLETPVRHRPDDFAASKDGRTDTGLQEIAVSGTARGGYRLFVPETYDETVELPLVVALHGGSGSGRDFIWTWLREARSRKFILLAPSAAGRTWSFQDASDADRIFSAVDQIRRLYAVGRDRLLLTGFSDGAIYALTAGLLPESPFTALAPVSGVLHPQSLDNADRRRIYLVHGTLDWMFPASYARQANEILKAAGADVLYREIPDLSHTYPREENARIIEWFDPERTLT